jgi:hypothetical protein
MLEMIFLEILLCKISKKIISNIQKSFSRRRRRHFLHQKCDFQPIIRILIILGHSPLVALLPRSHEGTLRNVFDFCAESTKIKRIPKVPFSQRGSKAANVAN